MDPRGPASCVERYLQVTCQSQSLPKFPVAHPYPPGENEFMVFLFFLCLLALACSLGFYLPVASLCTAQCGSHQPRVALEHLEMWLVHTEMHCEYKMLLPFRRPSQKEKVGEMSDECLSILITFRKYDILAILGEIVHVIMINFTSVFFYVGPRKLKSHGWLLLLSLGSAGVDWRVMGCALSPRSIGRKCCWRSWHQWARRMYLQTSTWSRPRCR